MAIATVEFFSECLRRCVNIKVILPNDVVGASEEENAKPFRTLLLLNGYTQQNTEWIYNSQIVELAGKYHLCVIMPSGENSFYLDGEATGRQYGTFVGKELLSYVRKTFRVSEKREDTFVGGISMGGFGALHTGLQFPEIYGRLFAFSSALIQHEVEEMKPEKGNEIANYEYYKLMFGEPSLLKNSENNPEVLIRKCQEQKIELPEIYMVCGTEDFLLEPNRRFESFLTSQKVEHIYYESAGEHNFGFWNQYLEPALKWLCDE